MDEEIYFKAQQVHQEIADIEYHLRQLKKAKKDRSDIYVGAVGDSGPLACLRGIERDTVLDYIIDFRTRRLEEAKKQFAQI